MARDLSGTYTLASGNPVTTGTTITSSWANNTFSDLATELTDSLSRSGYGGMLAPLRVTNGTVSVPSLSFTAATNYGAYYDSSGTALCLTAGGTKVLSASGSTGVVALPNNYILLNVSFTTQTISNITITKLTTSSAAGTDTASGWSTTNDEYTVPVTGLYSVTARALWDTGSTGRGFVCVYVAGASAVQAYSSNITSANPTAHSVTGYLELTAGDKLDVRVYQDTGGSLACTAANLRLAFLCAQ
jgi:hypothetical protein